MTVEPAYGREGDRFRTTGEPSYGRERVEWEKLDVEPKQKTKHLRMAISAMREDQFPVEPRVSNMKEVADKCLPQPSLPAEL